MAEEEKLAPTLEDLEEKTLIRRAALVVKRSPETFLGELEDSNWLSILGKNCNRVCESRLWSSTGLRSNP
jgi:hypothetical protein